MLGHTKSGIEDKFAVLLLREVFTVYIELPRGETALFSLSLLINGIPLTLNTTAMTLGVIRACVNVNKHKACPFIKS